MLPYVDYATEKFTPMLLLEIKRVLFLEEIKNMLNQPLVTYLLQKKKKKKRRKKEISRVLPHNPQGICIKEFIMLRSI